MSIPQVFHDPSLYVTSFQIFSKDDPSGALAMCPSGYMAYGGREETVSVEESGGFVLSFDFDVPELNKIIGSER